MVKIAPSSIIDFWRENSNIVHKRSSSQCCKMRLFEWFSNTVSFFFQQKIWKSENATAIFFTIPKPRFHTKSSKGWGHTEASLTGCSNMFCFEKSKVSLSFYNIFWAFFWWICARFAPWIFPFCGQGFCRENSKLSLIQTIVVCAFAPVTLVGQQKPHGHDNRYVIALHVQFPPFSNFPKIPSSSNWHHH